MNEFEARLSECLEALREGRWDIDECLRRYPEHAAELRPQLVAASKLMATYGQPEPSDDFASASRERFLVASGQRLQEAFDVEPHPSFFVAARVRFLAAAHQMRLARGGSQSRIAWMFQTHARAVASAAAVLIAALSFSTYTVASADGSLPGDWQYPVKLQTERIRLALAFSDGAKRDVKLGIAEERAREIEQLTKQGRIIGPGVLDRLVEQTQPLIDEAGPDWNTDDVARLHTLAEREQVALKQAEPQVDPAAQDALAQARDVSKEGVVLSDTILVARPDSLPRVVTPSVPLAALTDSSPTATPTIATPEASTTGSSTPEATLTVTASPSGVTVDTTPENSTGHVNWIRLAAGRFTTLIPSPADGWTISGMDVAAGPAPVPSLVKLSNVNSTSLITFNVKTGDMYWFISHSGRFDEVQMRMQREDGQIVVADPDYLRLVYGDSATIPFYVLRHIEVAPELTPTPRPEPSATPTAPQTP
jgi:uncharacterized protein DUF5667